MLRSPDHGKSAVHVQPCQVQAVAPVNPWAMVPAPPPSGDLSAFAAMVSKKGGLKGLSLASRDGVDSEGGDSPGENGALNVSPIE
eukprot:13025233-Alexandrium_andersonii.AAC.1